MQLPCESLTIPCWCWLHKSHCRRTHQ